MQWINFSDEKPTDDIYKFLCMYQDMQVESGRKYIYVSHITKEGYFHVPRMPYEDCWDVNTRIYKPIKWMLLPEEDE